MSIIRDKFVNRSWIVWAGFILLFLIVLIRVFQLQTVDKPKFEGIINSTKSTEVQQLKAQRGNIYANDGSSILATSVPEYSIGLDPTVTSQKFFDANIHELAEGLSRFFKDKSVSQYKQEISRARERGARFIALSKRRLAYDEREQLMQLPFFKEGRHEGGGYFNASEIRFHPYKSLALRTIGSVSKGDTIKGITGVEAEFDTYLRGKEGKGYYEKLPGGYLKPLTLDSDIASEPGYDVITTIDVNFQDIAESALRNKMIKTGAKYGSVTIMEIETGEIKAMTNLSRLNSGNGQIYYSDNKNYAVSEGADPGSTFKLASMLAALEKTKLKPDELIVNCTGAVRHKNQNMTCHSVHGQLTVREVFEKSCNVGVYALMKKAFDLENGKDFYKYLDKFKLNSTTGFQLKGEPVPVINAPGTTGFSAYTIPWLSIGYESRITPMQMLAFYNAVANDGYWVQPLLVKEIRSGKKVVKTFSANKPTSPIASAGNIKYMKEMLEGVVLNGTASKMNYGECKIAGKTGTAQKTIRGSYTRGVYYTSFAGYFPADNPKYSCIVVIDEPKGGNQYSGEVTAPVFKTIADKIYAFDMDMHQVHYVGSNQGVKTHKITAANSNDQRNVIKKLGGNTGPEKDIWTRPVQISSDSLVWQRINVEEDLNSLKGMTLKDALPILENNNYSVRYSGRGKVAEVSLTGKQTVRLVLK